MKSNFQSFVKYALNAWEMRAAKGLLSPASLERISPFVKKEIPSGVGSLFKNFGNQADRYLTGQPVIPSAARIPIQTNFQLAAAAPAYRQKIIGGMRKSLSSVRPAMPIPIRRLPAQLNNALQLNPEKAMQFKPMFDSLKSTAVENMPLNSRFPVRMRPTPQQTEDFANSIKQQRPDLYSKLNPRTIEQASFMSDITEASRPVIHANYRENVRHELGHYQDWKRPFQNQAVDFYNLVNRMNLARPGFTENLIKGPPGYFLVGQKNPWPSEITGQYQAIKNQTNPRAKALIDATLENYSSPGVEAMPDPVLKSIMAHLERNYQFPR